MKVRKKLLLLALPVIALLAWYQSQQASLTLQKLEAEGFRVDQRLASQPPLVIDRGNRRMAVIEGSRYVDFGFDQVVSIGTETDFYENSQEPLQLVIRLRQHGQTSVVLKATSPTDARRWQQQLNGYLDR